MDFGKRIASAQDAAKDSKWAYNDYSKKANRAGEKFDTAFDDRQGYGDIYQQARDRYYNSDEVNAARDTYQQARAAVDQLNTTIDKLPESIRQQYGGTGLTEAQRQRALSDQYSQNANTYNMLNTNYKNASADYNDLANRAMQEVFNVAGGNYKSQEDALNTLQSAWNTLLGQRNTAYGQNQTDRGLLAEQYGARDKWQLAQDQMALERWKQQQANARAAADRAAQMNLQKYLAASRERMAGMNRPTNTPRQTFSAPQRHESDGGLLGWLGNAFTRGADSWGKTWNKHGGMTLLGKGTFW
ncbi:hypothetical protein CQ476_38 [TM7 phage DolZOral124_53_65]|nr:hypothetical protein CQ476_38 [TM7 phage DolZOral124_53_65]